MRHSLRAASVVTGGGRRPGGSCRPCRMCSAG